MKDYLHIFLLIIILGSTSCTDEYKCRCLDNNQTFVTKGTITGLDVIPANITMTYENAFKIVVDNSSGYWDQATVELFDDDRTYLDISDGIKYIRRSSATFIEIPTASIVHNGEAVTGEINYACNFFLGDSSVVITGSFGMVACDDFRDNFEAEDCRWSCNLIHSGSGTEHCYVGCL